MEILAKFASGATFEKRIGNLEKITDSNVTAFRKAFQMLELQNRVLMQIVNDMVPATGKTLKLTSTGDIDFNAYFQEFTQNLMDEAKRTNEKPVIATPDEDAPIIFGGDQ